MLTQIKTNQQGAIWPVLVFVALVIVVGGILLLRREPEPERQPSDIFTSDIVESQTPVTTVPEARPAKPGHISLAAPSQIAVGADFEVQVMLDTLGSNVNLAQVALDYDPAHLEFIEWDEAGSVLSLRARDESVDGQVNLLRGAPGDGNAQDSDDGFTGQGQFIILRFKSLTRGQTSLTINPVSRMFLDDGLGSLLELTLENTTVVIK